MTEKNNNSNNQTQTPDSNQMPSQANLNFQTSQNSQASSAVPSRSTTSPANVPGKPRTQQKPNNAAAAFSTLPLSGQEKLRPPMFVNPAPPPPIWNPDRDCVSRSFGPPMRYPKSSSYRSGQPQQRSELTMSGLMANRAGSTTLSYPSTSAAHLPPYRHPNPKHVTISPPSPARSLPNIINTQAPQRDSAAERVGNQFPRTFGHTNVSMSQPLSNCANANPADHSKRDFKDFAKLLEASRNPLAARSLNTPSELSLHLSKCSSSLNCEQESNQNKLTGPNAGLSASAKIKTNTPTWIKAPQIDIPKELQISDVVKVPVKSETKTSDTGISQRSETQVLLSSQRSGSVNGRQSVFKRPKPPLSSNTTPCQQKRGRFDINYLLSKSDDSHHSINKRGQQTQPPPPPLLLPFSHSPPCFPPVLGTTPKGTEYQMPTFTGTAGHRQDSSLFREVSDANYLTTIVIFNRVIDQLMQVESMLDHNTKILFESNVKLPLMFFVMYLKSKLNHSNPQMQLQLPFSK